MQTRNFIPPSGISFIAEEGGISEFRLDANALKIVIAPDPTAKAVSVVQHINVGSVNEGAGNSGYSHLLEHMNFKGTPDHNHQSGNSYDDLMKRLGGIYNATTSLDRTNYHAKIPSQALDAYLEQESDRLRNAILKDADLATEMPVVVDEFDQGENEPDVVLDKHLMAAAFMEHPYRMPIIGARSEVMKVTAEQLQRRLYDVYYHPNNTTLIFVGGVEIEEALRLTLKHYGSIPPSAQPIPPVYTVEPRQQGERRTIVNRPGDLARVSIAFHIPPTDHADTFALTALSMILGGHEASRLHRRLVEQGVASQAFCWAQHLRHPGLLRLYAKLTPGTPVKKVERMLLAEVERIGQHGVSARELRHVKVMNRNGTVHLKANRHKWALSLSESEANSSWLFGERWDDRFEAVTGEDIRNAARRYLHADNRTVAIFQPTEAVPEPMPAASTPAAVPEPAPAASIPAAVPSTAPASAAVALSGPTGAVELSTDYGQKVQKQVLPNGLTVQFLPTAAAGAIAVTLAVRAGYFQPGDSRRFIGQVVARMLDRGSERFSKRRIASITSELLTDFSFGVSPFAINLGTNVPPQDLPRFFAVLSDVVQHPRFETDELALLRCHLEAELQEQDSEPYERALTALSRRLYGADTPHWRQSAAEELSELSGLTAADLRDWHDTIFSAEGAVLTVVGNFEPRQMLSLVEKHFGLWKGSPRAVLPCPAAPSASTQRQRIDVRLPGKDNLSILIGVPTVLNPPHNDYLAAFIANRALGGNPLTSRLGMEVREKRGLTYGIYSGLQDFGSCGSPWLIRMTTNAGKLSAALPVIDQVVADFIESGIGEEELASEKASAINALSLSLDDPLPIANRLMRYELAGLGEPHNAGFQIDTYAARVNALTKAEVDAAIRTHYSLDGAVTVVAGTLPD